MNFNNCRTRWPALRALPLALIGLSAGLAQAQTPPMEAGQFGWLLEGHAGFGGDNVDTLYYDNGKTTKMPAGRGTTVAGGLRYQLPNLPVELVGTLGIKFTFSPASNATPTFSRLVYALRADYRLNDEYWLGVGPTLHSSIKYDSDGYGNDQTFSNATGLTLMAGWRMLSLSFTQMDYKGQYGRTYNANSLALGIVGRF